MKTTRTRGLAVLFAVGLAWPAPSRATDAAADAAGKVNVSGTVNDGAGDPVSGIEIELLDARGQVTAKTATGQNGGYEMPCVETGQYKVRLTPGATGVQGDTVAAPVGADGLVVNWTVARSAPPLAAALAAGGRCDPLKIGAASPAPAGLPPAAVVGAAGAVVVGGTFGVLAASGALAGGGSSDGSPRLTSTASQ